MSKSSEQLRSIQKLSNAVGAMPQIRDMDEVKPLLDGQFHFRHQQGGLAVHCSDAVELQNMNSRIELPPCLSFNIVFRGKVEFILGGQAQHFGGNTHSLHQNQQDLRPYVECCGFILERPEVLTRKMQKGMHVKKVNVFAQKEWLQLRCQNEGEFSELWEIFQGQHSSVRHWQANDAIQSTAELMFKNAESQGMTSALQWEQLALGLLAQCMDALLKHIREEKSRSLELGEKTSIQHPHAQSDAYLKGRVDKALLTTSTLSEIAAELNTSVSTLQRRFKKAYGTTVIDYVRLRRLEIARTALLLEGKSIGEAAYLAGYNHPSNFISAFKKAFFMTPAELMEIQCTGKS